jgi:hypothetical protein
MDFLLTWNCRHIHNAWGEEAAFITRPSNVCNVQSASQSPASLLVIAFFVIFAVKYHPASFVNGSLDFFIPSVVCANAKADQR